MIGITAHITIPRRDWEIDPFMYSEDALADADRRFGRAVRAEVKNALEKLGERVEDPTLSHIEITLVDTARAEVDDDPEAHTP